MTSIALRLAAPLQSWGGFRHLVNINSVAPTEAVPRKSAINGLIGAALGSSDQGFGSARDLSGIGARYDLHVRVESRNPTTEDLQVIGPLPEPAAAMAERSYKLGTATTKALPTKRGGGNFPTTVSRRDFLAHSEFLVAIETDTETVAFWMNALRNPVFMPYLGRRSCAPSFPYLLGIHEGSVADLFKSLPWVDRYGENPIQALLAYEVAGDYDLHRAIEHPIAYTPPVRTRFHQLAWAKEHLR